MGATKVDHCFPLNGDITFPEVKGITDLLQLYRSSLPNITLSGPTYFAHIIQQQLNIMEAHKSQQNTYSILLIVTDGDVHDMPMTKRLLVNASHLPLSVIIVGVGKEQFEMMRELDADQEVLRAPNQEAAVRDLVQFVKLEDFP